MPIVFNTKSTTIKVPEEMKDELEKYLRQAGMVRVIIAPAFQPRTLAQNALWHAKINEIAYITGMDRDEIKDEIKETAMYMGYPCKLDESGYPAETDGRLIPKSSAEASISEMEILIDAVAIWAEQKGIDATGIWRN